MPRDGYPDDWVLYDADGLQVARIMLVVGGPNDGRWRWSLQIRPDGERLNGGQGYCDTGTEARELCESRVPVAPEGLSHAITAEGQASARRGPRS
jgi:hypothetical protein